MEDEIGLDDRQIIERDFDRIAAVESRKWDHNRHYYPLMIRLAVKGRCGTAVEAGCGVGELSRMLARYFNRVVGIDLSAGMLDKAQKSGVGNIKYLRQDVMAYAPVPGETDCILSAAAVHHLPFIAFIAKAKTELAPGGRLIIVDLYRQSTPSDYLLSGAAAPLNFAMNLIINGRAVQSTAEREAWRQHAEHDRYMTFSDIKQQAKQLLPGVKVKRLLFWRYVLYYVKPSILP